MHLWLTYLWYSSTFFNVSKWGCDVLFLRMLSCPLRRKKWLIAWRHYAAWSGGVVAMTMAGSPLSGILSWAPGMGTTRWQQDLWLRWILHSLAINKYLFNLKRKLHPEPKKISLLQFKQICSQEIEVSRPENGLYCCFFCSLHALLISKKIMELFSMFCNFPLI